MKWFSIIVCAGLTACASQAPVAPQSSRQSAVSYSRPAPESLRRIKIERLVLTEEQLRGLAALPRSRTRFGSRWVVTERPDTMRPGPWQTRLYIFEEWNADRRCIRVELSDHASYGVAHSWLNEKALFVSASWGRIVSTDFVLDTEGMKFPYIEDANYFRLIYSQEQPTQK